MSKGIMLWAVLAGMLPVTASALVIDTTANWDGNVTLGWMGSGQGLGVPLVENVFQDITFFFDEAAWGQTFKFYLADAPNFGNSLFQTSFTVEAANTIAINQALPGGSEVFALIDNNGFADYSAHFIFSDVYSGGHAYFGPIIPGAPIWEDYTTLDLKFFANFGSQIQHVPEPASLVLFGCGLALLAHARCRLGQVTGQ